MRNLTDAEARVIGVLLAGTPGLERERLRAASVPRSTYHAARRRAYAEGWVSDRYLPNPPAFGRPYGTFLLLRPYADRAQELTDRLSVLPDSVVLWASNQLLLGVAWHGNERTQTQLVESLATAGQASWIFALPVDLRGPSVPVYFDYEGLWSHLAEIAGTAAYPRGLGGMGESEGSNSARAMSPWSWAATQLVQRPFIAASQGRAGHLVGPLGLPWSQQKLLRAGQIHHRVFLTPGRPPPYQGRGADQLVFVTGTLLPEASPPKLFMTLTRDCRVFPFLYAAGSGRLLFGALGRPSGAGGDLPRADGRLPVMSVLRDHLEGIEVLQEVAANLRFPVDHRYDRLLPAGGPSR